MTRLLLLESDPDTAGAPYAEGMALLSRRITIACCLFAIGLCMTVYDVPPLEEMGLPSSWCGWFAVITSVLLMGHSWYFWRSFRRLLDKFIPDGLKDLQDVVRVYKLRPSLDGVGYEPNGPSGFWIADEGGEIVGFVGLSQFILLVIWRSLIRSTQNTAPATRKLAK
jgi:hypothetical protein